MISLEHIWKSYGRGRRRKDALRDVGAAIDFAPGGLGILGGKHSGKTTLLSIMAGVTHPDSGRVRRRMRVSWPLSWRGFAGSMTGDAQVAFLARIYQADRREVLRYVAELSRLGRKLYATTGSYSPREKDRLMQALVLALDFDAYLIDEAVPAIEPGFSADYEEAWQSRRSTSMQILFTSHAERAAAKCSAVALLHEGQLSSFMTTNEATETYTAFQRQTSVPKRKAHAQRA